MFDLDVVWWEFIARGTIVYLALLTIMRMSGKRTLGQFTPFDLLVVMLISEAVGNSMTGGDESVVGGIIVVVTMVTLNVAIAYAAARSRRFEDFMEGKEVLLGRNGRIFHDVLKANRIGENDVERALNSADIRLEEMEYLILEADGSINVLKKK